MSPKMAIVIRKDLKMRRGKEIAQGAHAAMAWLVKKISKIYLDFPHGVVVTQGGFSFEELTWLRGSFTKVCLQVDSEEELMQVFSDAIGKGLTAHIITDSGKTEFDGVATKTCLAIGPHEAERIDAVTGGLKLY